MGQIPMQRFSSLLNVYISTVFLEAGEIIAGGYSGLHRPTLDYDKYPINH